MNTPATPAQEVSVNIADHVSVIRFEREHKKNAFTGQMYDCMSEALQSGDQDEEVRCHLFLGSDGVFSAGNDIQDFIDHGLQQGGLGKEVLQFLRTLVTTEKPLVAGVDGLAIGIGATMLMHCDLVYASDRSFFQTPFVDLGLVPEAASSLLAPRLLGHQKAFSLLALGERLTAEEAERCGMVNKVTNSEDLENIAQAAAQNLGRKPMSALQTTRKLIRGDRASILERIDQEAEHFSTHLATKEAQNAFARFMNKP
ncbi:MAG: crotonase/enoyl-CoA hydratase family protein [Acidiferrobacterales bacterium]|nr:crotonase/enoyl-CoA hydratase family protein [Acidiferrobacterales bacterium]